MGNRLDAGEAPAATHFSVFRLAGEGEPLRTQFNTDAGKVRLLLLLDPSCPVCLRGASIVKREVLDQIPSPNLQTYVVWLPVLTELRADELEAAAQQAARFISDPRVWHFSDPEASLGHL
ncbi:MAG: hypothetical protein ACE5JM_17780, partial [Armatimonadota bacterium]